jgi:dynein heavy chain 2
MEGDARKEFVVGIVLDAVAPAGLRDELSSQLVLDPNGAMRAFLDDQTTMVFQATLTGGQLVSSNVVSFDTSSSCQVVLTKLKAGALSIGDIPANVAVSSMSHSPVSALYNQLHSVYGPLLGDSKDGGVNEKLRGLVAELEAGLGNVLRLTGGLNAPHGGMDPANAPLVGIVTPSDEFKMWSEIAFGHAAPQQLRARAAEVYRAFEPAKERFERLSELPDEEVLDLVDAFADCLDTAWRTPGDTAWDRRVYAEPRRTPHAHRRRRFRRTHPSEAARAGFRVDGRF